MTDIADIEKTCAEVQRLVKLSVWLRTAPFTTSMHLEFLYRDADFL